MKRVGRVVRTAQGIAVIRALDETYPNIGTNVIDENLDTVGRVVDVFGPVDQPYVAVSPAEDVQLPLLLGNLIYAR
jgi:RNA-binding protein